MARYLSTEWLDDPCDPLAEARARSGGGALRVGRVVSGAPDGDVRFTASIVDGEVRYEVGSVDDAEVTLTDTYPNAVALLRGELDPNAAFVRGQTKVAGPTGPLLDLLAAAGTEAYVRQREAALAATEV